MEEKLHSQKNSTCLKMCDKFEFFLLLLFMDLLINSFPVSIASSEGKCVKKSKSKHFMFYHIFGLRELVIVCTISIDVLGFKKFILK